MPRSYDEELEAARKGRDLAENEVDVMNRAMVALGKQLADCGRDNARLRAAVERLMDQPTMNPIDMTPDQRKELWAAHDQARAALEPKP